MPKATPNGSIYICKQGNTQREYLYLQAWPVAVVSYTPAVPAGSGTAALLAGDAAAETAEDYPEVAETAPADPKPTTSTGVTTSGTSDRAADGVAVSTAATPAIQLHYLHPDHLGTPRLATDSAQRIVWRWDSAPFGDTPAQEDPDGDGVRVTLNLRFPGQYFDAETGLHYNYFRDYDPAVGRYLESDPIGLRGGVNTYGYVGGRPLQFIDFLGLCKCIAKGKGGIGDKNSKYIGTLLGSRRIITCKYECEKPNGEKVPVTGTHIEEYWYSERYDDGSEGDCIGAVFDSSYNYQTMRLVYSRISFEPFDAASSPSQELQRWDKENCRDCPSK